MPYSKEVLEHLKVERRIFMTINVLAAIAIGILFWLIVQQQNRLNHADTEIQHQRYLVQLRDCRDLNRRHENTIQQISKLFNHRPDADADRRLVVELVNEILPVRNCLIFARVQVPDGHTP